MSERITIIETWHGSQPRAYAGDLWQGEIAFEKRTPLDEWEADPKVPVAIVRQWVQRITGFVDGGDDWFVPRLKHLIAKRDEPHVWEYTVERPYDD